MGTTSKAILVALAVLTVMDAVATQGRYRQTVVRETTHKVHWAINHDWSWG